jgi:hypothetical protein
MRRVMNASADLPRHFALDEREDGGSVVSLPMAADVAYLALRQLSHMLEISVDVSAHWMAP